MKGKIQIHSVHAKALEGNPLGDPADRLLPVYLPPGYDEGIARLPVIYFLHGFTGSALAWLNVSPFSPNVPERLDALIASGAVPPAIGVFIDGWSLLGGTQWDNSDGIARHRDYVVQDVVGYVDARLRTIPRAAARAIIGKSSGGYGALVMARHHPDVFAHACCHSGDSGFEYCYLPDFPKAAAALLKAGGVEPWFQDFIERGRTSKHRGDDHATINVLAMAAAYSPKKGAPLGIELPFELETARVREDVWQRWLALDPVRFVPKSLDAFRALQSLFIDCGTRDEANLRWGTRMVAEELRKGGVEVVHEEFEDGHMGINYRYDRSLRYLLPRLGREA